MSNVKTRVVMMPRTLSAAKGAKALLTGQFYEYTSIECPECLEMGDITDDCTICRGDGTVQKRVTVSWTTIKAIYAKAVEAFGE